MRIGLLGLGCNFESYFDCMKLLPLGAKSGDEFSQCELTAYKNITVVINQHEAK